jgi:hypothetical protein
MAFMKKSVALTTHPRFGSAEPSKREPAENNQARNARSDEATCIRCGSSLDEEQDGRSAVCSGCR